jgi:hypothetical protein
LSVATRFNSLSKRYEKAIIVFNCTYWLCTCSFSDRQHRSIVLVWIVRSIELKNLKNDLLLIVRNKFGNIIKTTAYDSKYGTARQNILQKECVKHIRIALAYYSQTVLFVWTANCIINLNLLCDIHPATMILTEKYLPSIYVNNFPGFDDLGQTLFRII